MATTTSNFSWPIPQSTDLVKDGATAIASLGSGIDTSMAELKGGTTGQVLSKTSNTDMDFTWVTTDDANAIQNSIVDAKGDLISATANDTPARLAVGTNNQVLMADSTTATGLKWGTPSSSVLGSAARTAASDLTTTSSSFVAMDTTNLRVTFTAPTSGIVIVKWHGYINAGSSIGSIGILDGSTLKAFSTASNGSYQSVDAAGNGMLKITGLTAGNSYTYDLAWKVQSGTYTAYGNGTNEQNTVMVVMAG